MLRYFFTNQPEAAFFFKPMGAKTMAIKNALNEMKKKNPPKLTFLSPFGKKMYILGYTDAAF
jgi:hypothetical protein